VLDLLGRGGMGAVYKGWQVSLERYVAIKILPPDFEEGDSNFAVRFKQEAKTMAKFQHPGIISIYDAGETASGLLYIVMEYVEGTDVSQMIRRKGKLDPINALAITAHVCDALAYAHSHGVIHRDIKPANIMVNNEGVVKVADFGLAKATGSAQMGLTRTDMSMGTPDFIAPEALIIGVNADHRADLYAVGVMLYNMLTGEIPRGRFKPSSERVQSDPRFDAIIDRAMEQDREHRYQSSQEIRRDLDVILSTPMERSAEAPAPARSAPAHKPVMKGPAQRSETPPPPHAGAKPEAGKSARAPEKSMNGMIAAIVGGAVVIGVGAFFAFKKPAPGGGQQGEAVADNAFVQEIAALAPEEQVKRVVAKLQDLNPGYDGKETHTIVDGRVTALNVTSEALVDMSPVRALTSLRTLQFSGLFKDNRSYPCRLTDLSPLKGLALTKLNISHSTVKDLSPLKGMPLQSLEFFSAAVKDLSPLAGMPLTDLQCSNNPISDLEPLRGMRLQWFKCMGTSIRDLSPLQNMPLKQINMHACLKVKDLSPLKGMPLDELVLGGTEIKDFSALLDVPLKTLEVYSTGHMADLSILRNHKTLTKINSTPLAKFFADTPAASSAPPAEALAFNGHRYKFFREVMSWDEAKLKAESMGGHLATITSKEENDWIAQTFVKQVAAERSLWLGGFSAVGKDKQKWTWITGEPFGFTMWKPGFPENAGIAALMYGPDDSGKPTFSGWNDINLTGMGVKDRRGGYLVEWDSDGKSAPAAASTTREVPADGSWLDVIPLVQLPRDLSQGDPKQGDADWRVENGALTASKTGNKAIISAELALPDSFDLTLRVNAALAGSNGERVAVHVPVGDHQVTVMLFLVFNNDGISHTILEMVGGKQGTKLTPGVLRRGVEHLVEIVVRREGAKASLECNVDKKQVLNWSGSEEEISVHSDWNRMKPHRLGLTAAGASITWRDVRVRRVDAGSLAVPTTLAPAASSTPTSEGKSSPQWQRMDFAAFDDKGGSNPNIRREDGALRLRKNSTWSAPNVNVRNVAVRAVLVWGVPHPYCARLLARMSSANSGAQYHLELDLDPGKARIGQWLGSLKELKPFALRPALKNGEDVTLQFASIGTRHYAWVNGNFLGSVEDTQITQAGRVGIQAMNACFKSMEWLPLDGMTEAEALKLLGVDEKEKR
jgi:hypothetical protein